MIMQLLAPLYLPILHLVTLATVPATFLYAVGGLLASPVVIPLLILAKFVVFLIFSPLLLLALPVALPVAGVLAFLCEAAKVTCAFFTVFTPLLWPVCFFMKWWKLTCLISQVLVKDTIMPWLVPLRFTFLAAVLPTVMMK